MKDTPFTTHIPSLAPVLRSGSFVDRPNRFTLVLKDEAVFTAYLPNTGLLEELCTENGLFHAVPFKSEKWYS